MVIAQHRPGLDTSTWAENTLNPHGTPFAADGQLKVIASTTCSAGLIAPSCTSRTPLAPLQITSGVFNANGAWLVCAVMAFNLTRAAATTTRASDLARAHTATVRRKLINVPARVASSARRLHLHLPTNWPWQKAWMNLYDHALPAR